MSTLTNEEISQLWNDAMHREDENVLSLISEIDALKKALAKLSRKRALLKSEYKFKIERTRKKSFHRGQSYMREKVAVALEKANLPDAAAVARSTHVDYDIEPVGRYTGP